MNEGTESRPATEMQAQGTRQIMQPMKGVRNSFYGNLLETEVLRKDAMESCFAWPARLVAKRDSTKSKEIR